jgi:hypothetical protein
VKLENGMLNYDLSVLMEKKAVNNVYEALAALPGISDKNGTLTLAGRRAWRSSSTADRPR